MNADATPIAADESRVRLDEISGAAIGGAQRVSSRLGHGFLERVYENALVLELRRAGLGVEQQKPCDVRYEGSIVGSYITDLIVERAVLIEIKAVESLHADHRSQCLNYLRATGLRVCLLLNFGRPRLEFRRVVWRF